MDVKLVCLMLSVVCMAGLGASAPAVDTAPSAANEQTSSNKIQNFESKLSKLRSLLADIAKHTGDKNKQNAAEKKSTESKMMSEARMSHEKDEKSRDSTMTEGLAGLQGETLQALELALQTIKDQQLHQYKQRTTSRHNVDMGTFRDEPIPATTNEKGSDSSRDSDVIKLAKLLTSAKSGRHNSEMNSEGYRQPPEGRFGLFRGEALRLVEDKLLGDVEVALENGLTLDEIMLDLERQEDKVRARDILGKLEERMAQQYRDK